ncbi:MAG: organomercurial lyase [Actinomycetota bacterium]
MRSPTSDNDVRVEVYRLFVEHGRPPMPIEIATAVGASSEEIERALHRLAEAHVLVLAPGTSYIWLANPLSALPSPFSVATDGRRWWGICIWDALGILAMLGSDGTVSSLCPDCGELLEVEVRDGEVTKGDGVVHYAVPAARWWDDIGFT